MSIDFCVVFFLVVLVQISFVCSELSGQLPNVTVKVGQNAYFQCNTAPSDFLIWDIYEPGETTLYNGNPANLYTPSPSKYLVINNNGLNNLTIFQTSTGDGFAYSCKTGVGSDETFYNLLVVDTPSVTLLPSTSLSVGSEVNITCTVNYGGATTSDPGFKLALAQSQDLQLAINIGTDSYTSTSPGCQYFDFQTTTYSLTPRKRVLSVSRTLANSDAGKYVNCTVTSTNPSYYDSATLEMLSMPAVTTKMEVQFQFNINRINSDGSYNVGDSINCTADGYPLSEVSWTLISLSPSGTSCSNCNGQQGPGFALLRISCPGTNTWNCTAWQGNTKQTSKQITFTVAGSNSTRDNIFQAPRDDDDWIFAMRIFQLVRQIQPGCKKERAKLDVESQLINDIFDAQNCTQSKPNA